MLRVRLDDPPSDRLRDAVRPRANPLFMERLRLPNELRDVVRPRVLRDVVRPRVLRDVVRPRVLRDVVRPRV